MSLDNMSNANHTMTAGAFTSTIKGKINGLEETIKATQEELNFYKKRFKPSEVKKRLLMTL